MDEEKSLNLCTELAGRQRKKLSKQNQSISTIKYIVIVASCFVSAAALCFGIYNLSTKQRQKSVQQSKQDETQCIECLARQELVNVKPNIYTNRPCCALNIENLKRTLQMLEKHQKQKRESKLLHKPMLPSPVSAHKYLTSSDKAMNFSNIDHVTLQLNTTADDTHSNNHARGVEIGHEGIKILYSGHYYVYSSIFYLPKTNVSSENFPYQTWFHYVYRTRPNSPAMSSVILRTVFTCCPNCSNSKDSVYIGGIFHLMAGDIIQVCLSGQGLMGEDTMRDDSSFLGLFMLASDHNP